MPPARRTIRRFLRENGLSLALFGLFLVSIVGQVAAGFQTFNGEQREHGAAVVGLASYLRSGHFIEATFENWESEFLQMAAFVLLTIILKQKGSSESKPLDEKKKESERKASAGSPWPVRRGGLLLRLYENSLSIALVLLFLVSLTLHAVGGAKEDNRERAFHGQPAVSTAAYVGTSRFWFESFQNWQSEFLSVGLLIVLSIVLRQKGSPQSKDVAAPHDETGE